MSKHILKKLEDYKKRHQFSDLALAEKMDVYPIYLYRWRKAKRIIGIYRKYVEEFLSKEKD